MLQENVIVLQDISEELMENVLQDVKFNLSSGMEQIAYVNLIMDNTTMHALPVLLAVQAILLEVYANVFLQNIFLTQLVLVAKYAQIMLMQKMIILVNVILDSKRKEIDAPQYVN